MQTNCNPEHKRLLSFYEFVCITLFLYLFCIFPLFIFRIAVSLAHTHIHFLLFFSALCVLAVFVRFFSCQFRLKSVALETRVNSEKIKSEKIASTSAVLEKRKWTYKYMLLHIFAMMLNRNLWLSTWQLQTNHQALFTIQYEKCEKNNEIIGWVEYMG